KCSPLSWCRTARATAGPSAPAASSRTSGHPAMSLDPTWLFLSLIPCALGFVLLVYGKKQASWPHLAAGALLTVYPYFVTNVASLILVGAAICGGLWLVLRTWWWACGESGGRPF